MQKETSTDQKMSWRSSSFNYETLVTTWCKDLLTDPNGDYVEISRAVDNAVEEVEKEAVD